jgi:hypothetical protein
MAAGLVVCILIIWGISSAFHKKPAVLSKATVGSPASTSDRSGEVPWDYQVQQSKVGDLLDGDMVLLPNNERIFERSEFCYRGPSVGTELYAGNNEKRIIKGRMM